jgi:hypothetical protein
MMLASRNLVSNRFFHSKMFFYVASVVDWCKKIFHMRPNPVAKLSMERTVTFSSLTFQKRNFSIKGICRLSRFGTCWSFFFFNFLAGLHTNQQSSID